MSACLRNAQLQRALQCVHLMRTFHAALHANTSRNQVQQTCATAILLSHLEYLASAFDRVAPVDEAISDSAAEATHQRLQERWHQRVLAQVRDVHVILRTRRNMSRTS